MTNNHRWVQTVIPSTFEPCEAFNTNNVKHEVLHGDALERLRALPSNSVDSLVTDPPAGIAFMNSEQSEEFASVARLRVLHAANGVTK